MTVQKLIAWASGMVEFIGGRDIPDGAIHVCTATGRDAIEFLFDHVREQSVLHDFGGLVALRVPEINPDWPRVDAVDLLIMWEELLRDLVGVGGGIVWERDHAR